MSLEHRARREREAAEGVLHVAVRQLQPLAIDAAQEISGEVEVLPLAGGPVQLDHRELELRMAREHGPLRRAEVLDEVIRHANSAVEQAAVAGRAVVGNPRLQQVPEAILLVRRHQLA